MAEKWRTVRVFISSTFRDMHAERDHLVRIVFPELKERCRKRHIQLIDVDLRWGVTEEQAEGGGALDICLDEIDSCRPYFVGLLGHRYGYIPPDQEHSITANEIYHGVLQNNLPRQLIDLRPFVEGILEGRTLLKKQVSCLVRCYHWDPEKRKYLLQQNITHEDEKTLRSTFDVYSIYQKDRSFFFFRSESLSRELAVSNLEDYFEADEALKAKLVRLKQEIINARLPYFEYDNLETFGQKVLETLWGRIDAEFPEKREDIERDWLKEEAEFHELFIADRTRRFVGRSDTLKRMHAFVDEGSDPGLMVVTGEPGCGKSALIARFTEEVSRNHPDWLILSHFVGASPSSTSLRRTLRRLCTQLNHALRAAEEVPEEYKELAQLFPELLQRASKTRRILLVIDALNQFERTDNAHTMRWLPQKLPQNTKIVVSTLSGEALDALKARRVGPRFEELSGLTVPESKEFVTSYLSEIRKDFPTPQIRDAFYDKIKSGHPLYILVALEELRVFPVYEEVGNRVARLPDTVPELFSQVLERIEGDFSRPLVRDFMSLIACGRQGMTGEELQAILKEYAPVIETDRPAAKLPDMLLAKLRRSFSAYLFERSGVIDFFHGQLKEAVGKRYLADEPDRDKMHQIIADYFEKRWSESYIRALDELPHQLTKARDWDSLERILCDLHFIENKCAAGMTYELIYDYNTALDNLPEAHPEKQERLKHEARVKKYTEDLIAYAKGEIKTLDIIPSVKPWSEEKIRQDIERIINNPTRLDRIRAFAQFVNSESHTLVKFASHPGFVIQQAYNSASSGPVVQAAEAPVNSDAYNFLLLKLASSRSCYDSHPVMFRMLDGHKDRVYDVSITQDGRRAISTGDDNVLKVWDLETGECIIDLNEHLSYVRSVSITPDGRKAVSGSDDNSLKVWDIKSGECYMTLKGHSNSVRSASITPDGRRAISRSDDHTLKIWDIESGQCLRTIEFENKTDYKGNICIAPNGRQAISGHDDGTLRIWDLESGECIRSLYFGHANWVYSICITPNGRKAVSVVDHCLCLWDLKSGKSCMQVSEIYFPFETINGLSITADGKRAIVATTNGLLHLRDLESGECFRIFDGHTSWVNSVSITPDGKRAISGSADNTLRVWDVESGISVRSMWFKKWRDNLLHLEIPQGEKIADGHLGPISSISITPEEKRAISASGDGSLRVWDIETGECLRILSGHLDYVHCVSVTPDGKRAISAGVDRTERVWDIDSGECLRSINHWVENISTSPDGRSIVSATDVRDIESGNCLIDLRGDTSYVDPICITPDGKRAVSGNQNGIVQVWNLKNGKCQKKLKGHRYNSKIWTINISHSGKIAVSGGADNTLKVWNLQTGKCLRTIEGHTDSVYSGVITPDGKRVISGSADNTLRVWDIESGECLAVCEGSTAVRSVSMVGCRGLFIYGTLSGDVITILSRNFPMETPLMTPARLWLHGDKGVTGRWDERITTVCPWCGQRFTVSDEILDVIRAINRDAGLSPERSPCLELPDEAWAEPRLLSECPLCHKPLKFNPFIVDNKGRY